MFLNRNCGIHFKVNTTTINFKTKNRKAFNWDLHSVLGFYGLLVLVLISLTGLFLAFDNAKTFVQAVTNHPGGKKEEKLRSVLSPDAVFPLEVAYRQMKTIYPGARETIITQPDDSLAPVRIIMQYPYTLESNIIKSLSF
ncbi:PepSY domain-containing protein [Flavitalea flava]